MIVVGIDPGTATTGFGVLKLNAKTKDVSLITYGQIKTAKESLMQDRLLKIYNSTTSLLEKHKPDVLVIEKLFFNTNVKTAIAVGQARGIYLLTAAELKIPVFEYTALQAKMAITGYGRAEKHDVRKKIQEVLKLDEDIKPIDASDALAIGLCHCLKMFG